MNRKNKELSHTGKSYIILGPRKQPKNSIIYKLWIIIQNISAKYIEN